MSAPREGEFARQLLDCQQKLYAYIMSLVFDRDAAEELLQQTNLVICNKVKQATEADSFVAWALGVARLEVFAYRRTKKSDRQLFDSELVEVIAAESPAAIEANQDQIAALRYCVEQLPTKQRELIGDRYRPGARVQELASRRGQTIEAVSKALYRARKFLLECIERRMRREST